VGDAPDADGYCRDSWIDLTDAGIAPPSADSSGERLHDVRDPDGDEDKTGDDHRTGPRSLPPAETQPRPSVDPDGLAIAHAGELPPEDERGAANRDHHHASEDEARDVHAFPLLLIVT
jgi:hypothetical protein